MASARPLPRILIADIAGAGLKALWSFAKRSTPCCGPATVRCFLTVLVVCSSRPHPTRAVDVAKINSMRCCRRIPLSLKTLFRKVSVNWNVRNPAAGFDRDGELRATAERLLGLHRSTVQTSGWRGKRTGRSQRVCGRQGVRESEEIAFAHD